MEGIAERNTVGRGFAGIRPDDAGRSTVTVAEADKHVEVGAKQSIAVAGESTSSESTAAAKSIHRTAERMAAVA